MQDHKISITQIYTCLLSNMEVDIEARKNFTDKLPNILNSNDTTWFKKSAAHLHLCAEW